MKIVIDIPNKYFDKYKQQAIEDWNEANENDKDFLNKGMHFEFDIEVDGTDIDENEIQIYGGSSSKEKEAKELWARIDWTPDSIDLKHLVEYTVKQLNRFKSVLESITGMK